MSIVRKTVAVSAALMRCIIGLGAAALVLFGIRKKPKNLTKNPQE